MELRCSPQKKRLRGDSVTTARCKKGYYYTEYSTSSPGLNKGKQARATLKMFPLKLWEEFLDCKGETCGLQGTVGSCPGDL